ncbi:MAG: serpin family protein [Vallitalea sp.]|nr:serpin family protein [Vallitalea sp.]
MKKIILLVVSSCLFMTSCVSNTVFDTGKNKVNTYKKVNYSENEVKQRKIQAKELAKDIKEDFVSSNNKFAIKLFKELNEENINVFISPASISMALSMLYNGSEGNTKKQISDTLYYNNYDMKYINEQYKNLMGRFSKIDNIDVIISNSMWINKHYEVNDDYINTVNSNYNSAVYNEDFNDKKTVNKINDWIDISTNGLIKKMINKIEPNTIMYLINAIYFNATWENAFKERATKKDNFNNSDGSISNVKMMNQKEGFTYYYDDEINAVRLPYKDGEVSMYAFVTKGENNINEFINDLSKNKLDDYFNSFKYYSNVRVKIPKFKVEYGIKELKDVLINMGITDAFDPSLANFEQINRESYTTSVKHKAVIEVDEKGTEAAAATIIEENTKSCQSEEEFKPEFIADKPFFYIIRDDRTGTILFMGVVNKL